jgi:hypothetical protein
MTSKRVHSYAKHFHDEQFVEIAGPNSAHQVLLFHNKGLMTEQARLLRVIIFMTVNQMMLHLKYGTPKEDYEIERLTALFKSLTDLEERLDCINAGTAINECVNEYFDAKEQREVYDLMESLYRC